MKLIVLARIWLVDKIIDSWGHDFRAAYRGLSNIRDSLPNIPIMALSATATSVRE